MTHADCSFQDLIEHLRNTLPILPDASIQKLVNDLEITIKDAKTIVALDDGERLDYFYEVMACLQDSMNDPNSTEDFGKTQVYHKTARTAANWSVKVLFFHTALCTLNL